MSTIINLYIDDSGTRHPDKKMGRAPAHGNDWFALGGILIKESDEDRARKLHQTFCRKWKVDGKLTPLHSSEIRARKSNFAWIEELSTSKQTEFYEDLYCLMRDCPVLGVSCVVDRPRYDLRYRASYGRNLWGLPNTAFPVLIERSLKYAISNNSKLRVLVEKSNKSADHQLMNYYRDLRNKGMPFGENMTGYSPLSGSDFVSGLHEFRTKEKSSPLIQLADLYLWPMAIGGYDKNNRPYRRLCDDKKLIDQWVIDNGGDINCEGIKYSCFE